MIVYLNRICIHFLEGYWYKEKVIQKSSRSDDQLNI